MMCWARWLAPYKTVYVEQIVRTAGKKTMIPEKSPSRDGVTMVEIALRVDCEVWGHQGKGEACFTSVFVG